MKIQWVVDHAMMRRAHHNNHTLYASVNGYWAVYPDGSEMAPWVSQAIGRELSYSNGRVHIGYPAQAKYRARQFLESLPSWTNP